MRIVTSDQYQRELLKECDLPGHTEIYVRNLQFNAFVGADPWGRTETSPGRADILQPVSCTIRVSLRDPFHSASTNDSVDASTINYSTLSKRVLQTVANRANACEMNLPDWTVHEMAHSILLALMDTREWTGIGQPHGPGPIDIESVSETESSIKLSKGSLMSDEVSFNLKYLFRDDVVLFKASQLHLKNMHITTLIGVNANERTTKQRIIASVTVDPYDEHKKDTYPLLEQIVYKTIEESSFETLEALAIHVANRALSLWLPAETKSTAKTKTRNTYTKITVELLKPTAVTMADAPAIKIIKAYNPAEHGTQPSPVIPFPLPGRLDDWLDGIGFRT